MSHIRNYGHRRASSVAASVTSFSIGSSGPEEGQLLVEYSHFVRKFFATARIRNRVYSGSGADEASARASLFEEAGKLLGVPSSQLQDEFYGDADPLVGRSF